MAAPRIYEPSILIDSVEYKTKARSVLLEPGDYINFGEPEWTFGAEIELGYGVAESHTLLQALENTLVDVVLKFADATVGATNPTATFQIRMPAIPFLTGASRGDRQTVSISVVTEAAPVIATS
jgi:hypothetical protein